MPENGFTYNRMPYSHYFDLPINNIFIDPRRPRRPQSRSLRFRYLERRIGSALWSTHTISASNECDFHTKIASFIISDGDLYQFKPMGQCNDSQ